MHPNETSFKCIQYNLTRPHDIMLPSLPTCYLCIMCTGSNLFSRLISRNKQLQLQLAFPQNKLFMESNRPRVELYFCSWQLFCTSTP